MITDDSGLKSESNESVNFMKNLGFRFGSDLARNFLINWKMQQGAAIFNRNH